MPGWWGQFGSNFIIPLPAPGGACMLEVRLGGLLRTNRARLNYKRYPYRAPQMPVFGKTSRARLDQCDSRLQRLLERVVERRNCAILTGHRDEKAQEKMVAEKKSKVHWPDGKHNKVPSLAVDVAPYPIPDWSDRKHFDVFAGYVLGVAEMLGIPIRWGGDWDSDHDLDDQTFNDLVHFELSHD